MPENPALLPGIPLVRCSNLLLATGAHISANYTELCADGSKVVGRDGDRVGSVRESLRVDVLDIGFCIAKPMEFV